MRIQKSSWGFGFAALLFSFMANAEAKMDFLSDYGYGGSTDPRTAVFADSSADSTARAAAGSAGFGDPATADVHTWDIPKDYAPETDTALLRKAWRGETPLQTLDRRRRRAKTARVLTGTGLVLAGPVLIGVGTATAAVQTLTYSGRDDSGPWLASGLISTGAGIFLLCTKWEAERKWERVARDRLQLSLHPSGKGALVTLRF